MTLSGKCLTILDINTQKNQSFLCILIFYFLFFFAATVSIEAVPQPSTVFQKKQGKKTIDVYWLSDDGGLISSLSPSIYLLLPRILAKVPSMVECN